MAKRSLFWGQASGKLGETVLYRAGGEQRTRTYVAKIKNPRTLAQVENRLSMSNFAQTYRNLKQILSVSFPNRTTAQSGFNAFVKANKSVNSPVLTPEAAKQGLCVPYGMLMSEGYINTWGTPQIREINGGFNVGFDFTNAKTAEEILTAMGNGSTVSDMTKVEDLLAGAGIPRDAMITIIKADYKDTGYLVDYTSVKMNEVGSHRGWANGHFEMEKSADGKLITFGWHVLQADAAESIYTVIISWKDAAGKLQITSSRMVCTEDAAEYAEQFVKGGEYYEDTLEFYGYNEGSVLG